MTSSEAQSPLIAKYARSWVPGEGNVIFDTRQPKTPLQYPMTMWKDPEAPHAVENLSKTITLHLIRVEMKK
jgi:hypothetical protein